MKRAWRLALCLLLAASLAGSALAATVEFTGSEKVRSGPSINAGVLGTVNAGSWLEYLYEDSVDNRGVTWYKVRFGSRSGWVSSKYSYVDDDEGTDEYMWVQVYGDSNIRSAPNLSAKKLGTVYRGTSLDYLGSTSWDERGVAWYRVMFNGREGWISSAYTELFP